MSRETSARDLASAIMKASRDLNADDESTVIVLVLTPDAARPDEFAVGMSCNRGEATPESIAQTLSLISENVAGLDPSEMIRTKHEAAPCGKCHACVAKRAHVH